MSDVDIESVEKQITDSFDVPENTIHNIKQDTESVVKSVFNEHGIDVTNDAIELLQHRLLSKTLQRMRKTQDKNGDDASLLTPTTPEKHVQRLADEMKAKGDAAQSNIAVVAGSLSNDVAWDHPISQYVNAKMEEKYG